MKKVMKKNIKTMNTDACIHCGICTEHCTFLSKYEIDIGEIRHHPGLAYHCFLCGTCSDVCPKGIDGRQVILNMRKEQVQDNNGKLRGKGYGLLLWEKSDYRFRNYQNTYGKSVLFTGCNFPSVYPETTRYLAALLTEKAQLGVVFDCCGKPVAELGLEAKENKIVEDMNQRLEQAGVEEVVMLCPNCYHFLKGRLKVKMVSIYQKLKTLSLGQQVNEELQFFLPCPDRQSKEILGQLSSFMIKEPKVYSNCQCCGLGGCAGVKEPELAVKMTEGLKETDKLCTYCASCCGNLVRRGCDHTEHILIKILGRKEQPDTKRSLLNRIKWKYWKEK